MKTKTVSPSRRAPRAGALANAPKTPDKKGPDISIAKTSTMMNAAVTLSDNDFRKMCGSEVDDFNQILLREALATLWLPSTDEDVLKKRLNTVMAAMKAFEPKDEIEGMLAAQAVALHFGAMECFKRTMTPGQPSDFVSKLRKDGANLARGMTDMLEALDRKRGKGTKQTICVERVVVQDGGQAIVGAVSAAAARGME